jgi:hypothetical protein
MAPIGSTTYAQATKGKKYEETSDVHDGSPPSSGNSRNLSHRARQSGANKRANLSQTFFSCRLSSQCFGLHRESKLILKNVGCNDIHGTTKERIEPVPSPTGVGKRCGLFAPAFRRRQLPRSDSLHRARDATMTHCVAQPFSPAPWCSGLLGRPRVPGSFAQRELGNPNQTRMHPKARSKLGEYSDGVGGARPTGDQHDASGSV